MGVLDFTPNQWAIVGLVLVLGWLLGLLSRSGGARWRREARAENAARIEAERRLEAANARIVELERLAHPVAPGTAGAIGAAAAGRRDDLALIRGIGRDREVRLNEAGLHSYHDVAALSEADARALEARLGLSDGTIARERWREQAITLRDEGVEAHRARYAI
jgi:predicted flap endonuclease-1-like 5' DNA nuclease